MNPETSIEAAAQGIIAQTGLEPGKFADLMADVVRNWCSERGLQVSRDEIEDLFSRQAALMARAARGRSGEPS